MKFPRFRLALLLLSQATAVAAGSVRGSSQLALQAVRDLSEESSEEDFSRENFRPLRFLTEHDHRRLLPHSGVMRTLIIRVTDSEGNQPVTDARRESDSWFGTYNLTYAGNANSLSSMYDQCSGGKLLFVPATGTNVVDGVLEITMDQSLDGLRIADCIPLVRNKFNALNAELGIEFESYSMIIPAVVGGCGGLARQGGNHQIYSCGSDRSLELVVHEFGHNLGWHHSGLPDAGGYDDNSCMMGCCAGAQQMCFNAAKSWYSGWYSEVGKDGHEDLSDFDTPGQWANMKLVGISDYLDGVFDEDEYRVVTRMTYGLYMMFNRKKGVINGVRAYGDQVVIVQQWGEGGRSKVLGVLDEENPSFFFSNRDWYDFDIEVKLCEIFYAPTVTGPEVMGGTATQSSTAAGAEAGRARDSNFDQNWSGHSVTHTEGGDEDESPWWKLTLDEPEDIEHIRIYNRGDCCGSRLNNAVVKMSDASGNVLYNHNLGNAVSVRDLYLGKVVQNVKEVTIKLQGDKILSLAEVQIFGPLGMPRERLPDHARVVTYISDGPMDIDCGTTDAPTLTPSPSLAPTVSYQPTIYKAIPKEVTLLRDASPCVIQSNPGAHPDRIKCMVEPTASSNEPGGYDNEPVALRGLDGCLIVVQPVTWAWSGTAFVFQSDEPLDFINECFASGVLITEQGPTATPSMAPSVEVIPNDVVLLRDETPCVFQHNPSNHVDRFKCMIQPTASSNEPGGEDNDPVALRGEDGCLAVVQPITWAYQGTMFIFQSDSSLDVINACFRPDVLIAKSKPTAMPSTAPSVEVIPNDVVLLRDETPCVFQHNPDNHADRFKCTLRRTTSSNEPGGEDNDPVALRGQDGCLIVVQPVTWAYQGTMFIFQSDSNLDATNACFGPNVLITKSKPTAVPSVAPSGPGFPILLRDASPCVFQHNPSNHPDRYKCTVEATAPNSEPGGYDNDSIAMNGLNGCKIELKPVTWAWSGTMLIFQSKESLEVINACFAPGTLIAPTSALFD